MLNISHIIIFKRRDQFDHIFENIYFDLLFLIRVEYPDWSNTTYQRLVTPQY